MKTWNKVSFPAMTSIKMNVYDLMLCSTTENLPDNIHDQADVPSPSTFIDIAHPHTQTQNGEAVEKRTF